MGDTPAIGDLEYESFLKTGDEGFDWVRPKDEWQAISLNYTSGTTGNPQGCSVPSPRIVLDVHGKRECLEHAEPTNLSVYRSHVSL